MPFAHGKIGLVGMSPQVEDTVSCRSVGLSPPALASSASSRATASPTSSFHDRSRSTATAVSRSTGFHRFSAERHQPGCRRTARRCLHQFGHAALIGSHSLVDLLHIGSWPQLGGTSPELPRKLLRQIRGHAVAARVRACRAPPTARLDVGLWRDPNADPLLRHKTAELAHVTLRRRQPRGGTLSASAEASPSTAPPSQSIIAPVM